MTSPRPIRSVRIASVLALVAAWPLGARALAQAPSEAPPVAPADAQVTAASLRATVAYLADDARRGRSTGSPELVDAANFLAARLAAAGVAPGGDDGTYLQRVPLARVEYDGAPTLVTLNAAGERTPAVYGVDFDAPSGVGSERELELRIVRSSDDLPEAPSPSTALFVDVERRRDQRALISAAGTGWGLVLTRGSSRPGRAPQSATPRSRVLREAGTPQPSLRARGPLAERLAAGEVARVHVALPGRVVEEPTYNVIGVVRGTGTPERPELAGETIVFSAHYDHIGMKADAGPGEDAVHNGADDDASGCAAVVEVAEAFALGAPPARTLVFLFATGEEIGLVGTKYYLDHPLVALEATVCNLNFEMIGRPDDLAGGTGKLWLTGFERSNLGPAFAAEGLSVVADPRPDQRFFQRSDNYAFALRGIVAQTLSSYDLHSDYHRVSDEIETLDFAHMESAVRSALIGARGLASGAIDPEWAPDGAPR